MITLPADAVPNSASPRLKDNNLIQRPATGGAAILIVRPGSRFIVDMVFPPMPADKARVVTARLVRAKRQGLRVEFPLLVSQGNAGNPVVNGSGANGISLPLRGLVAGYVIKEGYWLHVVDGNGQYFLHQVAADVVVPGDGIVTLTVDPPLRTVLVDGNAVNISNPVVEGFVTSEANWEIPTNYLVVVAFTLEEAA